MADDDETGGQVSEQQQPETRKRTRTRKTTAAPTSNSRLERRAAKVKETILEAVQWVGLDFGGEELSFVETLKRDADRVGHGVAAIAENFKPFGVVIDKVFGVTGPLAIFVALAPSIRAARRDLTAKLTERRRRQEEAAREAELQEQTDESRGRDASDLWGADLPMGEVPMPTSDVAAA